MENSINEQDSLKDFLIAIDKFSEYHKTSIPLCAAENVLSPFSKLPLSTDLQERYIMGGLYDYKIEDNFIGSEFLIPFYEQINHQCKKLYGSIYADARTLSGMNSITSVLMALSDNKSTIMLSSPECGGHPSIPEICNRLGLKIIPMPYDFNNFDFDYEKINQLLKRVNVDIILLAPSDIIVPPSINNISVPEGTILIYDATQTLGLIAGKAVSNPFIQNENLILLGGTHKTLPGPTCGLIMTNNMKLAKKIDNSISPKFIRNTQMHQVTSLLLTLIEMEYYGKKYSEKIIENSNLLGKILSEIGISVASINNVYSKTHQIFLLMTQGDMEKVYKQSIYYGITLNKKEKRLFNNYGIRLGVQEISRYNWGEEELSVVGEIFHKLIIESESNDIEPLIGLLKNKKQIHFTFDRNIIDSLKLRLQKD